MEEHINKERELKTTLHSCGKDMTVVLNVDGDTPSWAHLSLIVDRSFLSRSREG